MFRRAGSAFLVYDMFTELFWEIVCVCVCVCVCVWVVCVCVCVRARVRVRTRQVWSLSFRFLGVYSKCAYIGLVYMGVCYVTHTHTTLTLTRIHSNTHVTTNALNKPHSSRVRRHVCPPPLFWCSVTSAALDRVGVLSRQSSGYMGGGGSAAWQESVSMSERARERESQRMRL